MSYTSKYTGQQIDNAIAEIPTIKNNINAVQGEISTIKNTTIQSLSGEVATVKSQMSTLRNDLDMNFNEHDNYELSINRIDSSLNTTIDNLGTLQNLVSNKVGIATYNEKMSELEKKDGELASLISEGDLNTLNSCMESINTVSSKIATAETNILANQTNISTNQSNIATIINTTIPSIENNINNINTDMESLNTAVQDISNDYVTSAELDVKENSILNSVSNTYVTQTSFTEIYNTLNSSYYTVTQIEELLTNYIDKTQYDSDIAALNDTISSLEKKLDELEKKIDNNEGWLS